MIGLPNNSAQKPPKIQVPCSEDWDKMQDTERGKYCSKCKQTVHDFTSFTNDEIINTIKENSGQLCARILERNRRPIWSTLKSVLNFSLAFLLIAFWDLKKSFAQIADEKGEIHEIAPLKVKRSNTFRGILRDTENNEVLPFATIQAYSQNDKRVAACITDQEGKFSFKLDSTDLTEIRVEVKYIGYQDTSFKIPIVADIISPLKLFASEVQEIPLIRIRPREIMGSMVIGVMRIPAAEQPKIIQDKTGTTRTYRAKEIEQFNLGR